MMYDMKDNYDDEKFDKYMQKLASLVRDHEGFVKIESWNSVLGNPMFISCIYYEKISDWAKLIESRKYLKLVNRDFNKLYTNVRYPLLNNQ